MRVVTIVYVDSKKEIDDAKEYAISNIKGSWEVKIPPVGDWNIPLVAGISDSIHFVSERC